MNGLSRDKVADLQQSFDVYDRDKDGLVSFTELSDLMNYVGAKCTESELQDLVNEVDVNERGHISKDDFISLMGRKLKDSDTEDELIEAFQIFDKDNSKLISAKKLLDVFRKIDDTIKEEEVLQMIKENDVDGDGFLNYDEFVRMVKNK